MPDLIRHPVPSWIPAFAGMTILRYLIAGVIITRVSVIIAYLLFLLTSVSMGYSIRQAMVLADVTEKH